MKSFAAVVLLFIAGCSANPRVPAAAEAQAPTPPADQQAQERSQLVFESVGAWDRVLFADELVPTGDAIAERLGRGDLGAFDVPGYAESLEQWRTLASGRYPNGKQCSDPPSPSAIIRASSPAANPVDSRVDCDPECVATITIRDPANPRYDEFRERWTVALPSDPAAWPAAIRDGAWEAQPPPKPEDGVGGLGVLGSLVGGKDPRPTISVRDLDQQGDWAGVKVGSADLTEVVEDFGVCAQAATGKTWRDWWGNQFVVALDAAGKVTRCESAIPDHLARPAFACECDALLDKANFGPGDADRRFRAYLDYSDPTRPRPKSNAFGPNQLARSAYLSSEATGDDPLSPTLAVNVLRYNALDSCLVHLTTELEVDVPTNFTLDGTGRVTWLEVEWPSTIPTDFAKCAALILSAAKFSCPMNDDARLTTNLKVSVSRRAPAQILKVEEPATDE